MLSTPEEHKDFKANNPFAERIFSDGGKCKFCNSGRVVKHGKKGEKQRYLCKDCGRKFVNVSHHARMRVPREAIALALELYYDGLSLRKVARHINKIYKLGIAHSTIWEWIQKYTPLVKDFYHSLTPTVTGTWHIDETVVKVSGKQWWFWEVIDRDSRTVLGTHLSRTRTFMDAKSVFSEAYNMSKKKPHTVICDGLGVYRKGLKKAIGAKKVTYFLNFIQNAGISKEHPNNNNRIERFHATLKERVKIMRGLQNPKNLLDGFCLHYNLIRPHQTLKSTPAQATGIELPFNDGWGDLIDWATYYRTLANSN